MLTVIIPAVELFDEDTLEFITIPKTVLKLEHSLVSLWHWEARWKKSFINTETKTPEESVDYIRCMVVNKEPILDMVFNHIPKSVIEEINEYIAHPMTATWFNGDSSKKSRDIVTAEVIYYWMISLQIPFTCERWHLNRLLTLVKVCNVKNAPGKKIGKRDIMNRNRALNAARKQTLGTSG